MYKAIQMAVILIMTLAQATYAVPKSQIESSIIFNTANYEVIEDVIFYEQYNFFNNSRFDEEEKNDLRLIANYLKKKCPEKEILYLRSLGNLNSEKVYRCMQITDGKLVDETEMNIYVKSDGSVRIFFLEGYWLGDGLGDDTAPFKVTEDDAKEILIDYLANHPNAVKELEVWGNKYTCTIQKYIQYYEYPAWKMCFDVGNSYILIDATTGEIIDEYFFSGIFID